MSSATTVVTAVAMAVQVAAVRAVVVAVASVAMASPQHAKARLVALAKAHVWVLANRVAVLSLPLVAKQATLRSLLLRVIAVKVAPHHATTTNHVAATASSEQAVTVLTALVAVVASATNAAVAATKSQKPKALNLGLFLWGQLASERYISKCSPALSPPKIT